MGDRLHALRRRRWRQARRGREAAVFRRAAKFLFGFGPPLRRRGRRRQSAQRRRRRQTQRNSADDRSVPRDLDEKGNSAAAWLDFPRRASRRRSDSLRRVRGGRRPAVLAVKPEEMKEIEVEVNILSVPRRLPWKSPEELLAELRPGVDGVGPPRRRQPGTDVSQVWEQLPEKKDFLSNLLKGRPGGRRLEERPCRVPRLPGQGVQGVKP